MKTAAAVVTIVSLATCLSAPAMYFTGDTGAATYKTILLLASVVYFIAATLWMGLKSPAEERGM